MLDLTPDHDQAIYRILDLVNGAALSQVIAVAAELQILDLLAAAPMAASELANVVACNEPALRRLLRALASADFCTEQADGTFSLTRTGALLCAGAHAATVHPQSGHG